MAADKKQVWDKPNPVKDHETLSPEMKARARARAKAAGRPYPNMVDNIWAAKNEEKVVSGGYRDKTGTWHPPVTASNIAKQKADKQKKIASALTSVRKKDTPAGRLQGTTSLRQTYTKDTPGQVNELKYSKIPNKETKTTFAASFLNLKPRGQAQPTYRPVIRKPKTADAGTREMYKEDAKYSVKVGGLSTDNSQVTKRLMVRAKSEDEARKLADQKFQSKLPVNSMKWFGSKNIQKVQEEAIGVCRYCKSAYSNKALHIKQCKSWPVGEQTELKWNKLRTYIKK